MNLTTKLLENIKTLGLESLGIYYGVYAGIVEDNQDKSNLFRLRVKVPSLFEETLDWAKPRGIFAGKNYGIFALPQKGDNVWITFENGNPQFPIWEYGAVAYNEKPQEAQQTTILIKNKKGVQIILDESGKIELSNAENNLKTILNALLNALKSLQIITPAGNGSISPNDVVKLNQIAENINNLLK